MIKAPLAFQTAGYVQLPAAQPNTSQDQRLHSNLRFWTPELHYVWFAVYMAVIITINRLRFDTVEFGIYVPTCYTNLLPPSSGSSLLMLQAARMRCRVFLCVQTFQRYLVPASLNTKAASVSIYQICHGFSPRTNQYFGSNPVCVCREWGVWGVKMCLMYWACRL